MLEADPQALLCEGETMFVGSLHGRKQALLATEGQQGKRPARHSICHVISGSPLTWAFTADNSDEQAQHGHSDPLSGSCSCKNAPRPQAGAARR